MFRARAREGRERAREHEKREKSLMPYREEEERQGERGVNKRERGGGYILRGMEQRGERWGGASAQ